MCGYWSDRGHPPFFLAAEDAGATANRKDVEELQTIRDLISQRVEDAKTAMVGGKKWTDFVF